MKLNVVNTQNATKGSMEIPVSEQVRNDLIRRAVEAYQSQQRQPYGADPRAGLRYSTDISKRRRKYRGSYGQGIARTPRKVLSRSGRQIFWVGAEAPNTRGGRRAHPPKATKIWARKINKKERRKAINSALTAALNKELVLARGHKIPDNYPFILDQDWESLGKTKELATALNNIGFTEDLKRGRNGGKSVLIITESEELARAANNIPGVDAARLEELNAHLLAPGAHPGRATLITFTSAQRITGKTRKAPKAAEKEAAA